MTKVHRVNTDQQERLFAPLEISCEHALAITMRFYGKFGHAERLGGERDTNFLIKCADGKFVLKVSHPSEDPKVLRREADIISHAACQSNAFQLPTVIPAIDGTDISSTHIRGRKVYFRLIPFITGRQLSTIDRQDWPVMTLGKLTGALNTALEHAAQPIPQRDMVWNAFRLDKLKELIEIPREDGLESAIEAAFSRYMNHAAGPISAMPRITLHNDLNPHNIVLDDDDGERRVGIFDFGDAVFGPKIQEFATLASYLLDTANPGADLYAAFTGYQQIARVTRNEARWIPDLIKARAVTTLLITNWRAKQMPEHKEYILRNAASARACLGFLSETKIAELATQFVHICDQEADTCQK